jgi:hypothetical protein
MDAKRIMPIITVQASACRLELEGADGILFRDTGAAPGGRAGWIRELAGSLSIPWMLEAPFRDWAELEEALEAGADKVVLAGFPEDPLMSAAVHRYGRSRVAATLPVVLAGARWQVAPEGPEALDWMTGLEQRGCGEILLRATPGGAASADLFQRAARLALSVLCLCPGDQILAAEAMLHGADGIAYADLAQSPMQWKQAIAVRGLAFRD